MKILSNRDYKLLNNNVVKQLLYNKCGSCEYWSGDKLKVFDYIKDYGYSIESGLCKKWKFNNYLDKFAEPYYDYGCKNWELFDLK